MLPENNGRKPLSIRTKPFLILVGLLYQTYDWKELDSQGLGVWVQLGPMRRYFSLNWTRLEEHLQFLERNGYIRILHREHGKALIQPAIPTLFDSMRQLGDEAERRNTSIIAQIKSILNGKEPSDG